MVVLVGLSCKANHRVSFIDISPLAGFAYRAAVGAGGGQAAPAFVCFEVGGDGVGIVHGDGGVGGSNVGHGVHIASPFHEVPVFVRRSNQGDHFPSVVEGHPLAGLGDRAAKGARYGEAILACRRLHSDTKPINDMLGLADDRTPFGASEKQPDEFSVFVHCRA